jgi:hypothetical protein
MNFVAELNLWLRVWGTTFFTGSDIEMTEQSKINPCLFKRTSETEDHVLYCTVQHACHKGKSIIIQIEAVTANVSVTVHRWDISILTNVPHIFYTVVMQIIFSSLTFTYKLLYSLWTNPESIE